MHPLDVVLRDAIHPRLKPKGWTRSGRFFRMASPEGDVAVIHVHPFRLGLAEVEALVDGGVVTPVNLRRNGQYGTPAHKLAEPDALWQERLTGPPRPGELGDWTWLADLEGDPRLEAFAEAVEGFADHLTALLDRDRLLEVVRDPRTPLPRLQARPREVSVAMLLSYRGPSPELDQLIEHLKTLEWGPRAIGAIRAELAS